MTLVFNQRATSRSAVQALPIILLLCGVAHTQSGIPAGFEPIDVAFRAFIEANSLPGASLAIAKDGRLVLAKSYGFSDVEQGLPVRPDSLFRFASIGKTITAIAVMKLVESGKLALDDKAFDILSNIRPRSGRIGDSRTASITIRNLLSHSGGWDVTKTGDPIVAPFSQQIAVAMGVPFPPLPSAIISYILDRGLDFTPGTRFAYSNFGYLVLGRVIEKVSGKSYEEFVRLQVLAPLGIERMRLAKTALSSRLASEVRYYDYPGAPLFDSLMPGVSGKVSEPYSGIVAMESADSAGAWAASPIDLVRAFAMLDGWGVAAILGPESIRQMLTPVFPIPGETTVEGKPLYAGLGMFMDSTGSDGIWFHSGGTFGTSSFASRPRLGWSWAAVFNSAPRDFLYSSPNADFNGDLQRILSIGALESVSWPDDDLFPQYLPSGLPTISSGGVVNAASGESAAVAPGELVTIFGSFLGPSKGVQLLASPEGNFPIEYSGTQVMINGVAAPLLFVSGSQINAVAGFGIDPTVPVRLSVRAFGYESEPIVLPAAAAAPALFTQSGLGAGPAAALNEDGSPNSAANPAGARSIVAVFGTGFGSTDPISVDGQLTGKIPARLALPVRVTVGGRDALVTYGGNAPQLVAGVIQINFQIPGGVEPGPAAVAVTIAGFTTATVVTIAIK